MTDFKKIMTNQAELVEAELDIALASNTNTPAALTEAMRYSVLGGGKRIRALLVFAAGQLFDAKPEALYPPALAVELIHAYSLVHDDLPAMDDDDLRRGKPSCHIAFDEATAILVGDALQALAFEILTNDNNYTAETRVQMVNTLAKAAGPSGMVGGQVLDIMSENKSIPIEALQTLHQKKTGALIKASIMMGAYGAGCAGQQQLTQLAQFADNIGLAFQVQDDILDVTSSTEMLGKPQGSDNQKEKSTYPALLGLSEAKAKVKVLLEGALDAIDAFSGDTKPLKAMAELIVQRSH